MGPRFIRFNVVGALGIGVRLLVVAVLVSGLGLHYLVATAIAIEASVLHNFFWHLRWTWGASRARDGWRWPAPANHVFFRLVAFHASNGLVSILGAMVLMPMLVGALGINYLIANVITVCVTGMLNFFLGDRLIFRRGDQSA
jgi:dolichol-phosphate mannosyltransferase